MAAAWREVLGYQPPEPLLAITLAHVCLENDNGRGLWNNNPGNLTTTEGNRYYLLSSLNVNAIGERISQDDPDRVVLRFWDFATPEAGFLAYAEWIYARPEFFGAAKTGNVAEFARQIKKTGYTPYINPDAVAKSLAAMMKQNAPVAPVFADPVQAQALVGLGAGLAVIAGGYILERFGL